jgi:acetyltransferase
MHKMIAYARARGTDALVGQVLADNDRMLRLLRGLGFTIEFAGNATYEARLRLAA